MQEMKTQNPSIKPMNQAVKKQDVFPPLYFNQDFSLGKQVGHGFEPEFFEYRKHVDPVLDGNKSINCGDGIDYFYAKHSFTGDEFADIALINTNNKQSSDPKFHSC